MNRQVKNYLWFAAHTKLFTVFVHELVYTVYCVRIHYTIQVHKLIFSVGT